MVCPKCQSLYITEGSETEWCPKCNPPKTVKKIYSLTGSKKKLKMRHRQLKFQLINIVRRFSFESVIKMLNESRNRSNSFNSDLTNGVGGNTFIQDWFEISYTMGIIYQSYYQENVKYNISKKAPANLLYEVRDFAKNLYMNEISLYHISSNHMVLAEYENDANYIGDQIKFTEKWIPIKHRMELLGISPNNPENKTEYATKLWLRRTELNEIVEDLTKQIPVAKEIFEAIRWEQMLIFAYPFQKFPIRKTRNRLETFFSFLEELALYNKEIINIKEWNTIITKSIKAPDLEYLDLNLIPNPAKIFQFPSLFFQLSQQILIPLEFIKKYVSSMKMLYGNPEYRKFLNKYGEMVEIYLQNWIKSLRVDFKDKNGISLFRYKNSSISPTEELFDLGFIHRATKNFFIVEVKAPIRFNFGSPKDLEELYLKDFEEFRDRDVPRIKSNLDKLGILGFTLIPIFMHFSSFISSNSSFIPFKQVDGINIAFSRADVNAIANSCIMEVDPNIKLEEIYKIPDNLEDLSKNLEVRNLLEEREWDYEDLSHFMPSIASQHYFLDTVKILNIDLDFKPPEINGTPKNRARGTYGCWDIPEYLLKEIKKRKIKPGDFINILIYRNQIGSPQITLVQYHKFI